MQVVDAERYIDVSLEALRPFADPLWRRELEFTRPSQALVEDVGGPGAGLRLRQAPAGPGGAPGIDAAVALVFPDPLLHLAGNPFLELRRVIAWAYARWLTEVHLPAHPEARGMLHLPMADPEAARRLVAEFGGRPQVAGAYLTGAETLEPHRNEFAPLYAEMQDRGLLLALLPAASWASSPFDMLDTYLAFWSLSAPFQHGFLMVNWLLHGMPERFPRLRCLFAGAGLAWAHFVGHRLDREFLQRPSEAPAVRERPSRLLRRCWFTTHPLDHPPSPSYLERVFALLGPDRILYGSGLPHWDFDEPGEVERRLPFLDAAQREAVLGGNALALLGEAGERSAGERAAGAPSAGAQAAAQVDAGVTAP